MAEAAEITDEQKQRAFDTLHNLPFAKMIGMRLVHMGPNEAVIEIEMRDELRQPSGVLHGGVTATLIDTAMAFAVITRLAEDERASTIDLTVHYLRPHTTGTITCTGKVVRAGNKIFTVSADVVNEQGKLIATALSTYTKV
ncbi:MAG: PaaI family thioesterase [Acidobacteriota bacterium]|nr:PaaI family thioesterase [Blastocatellia bacterium]MDQ3490631.1 PaaI family thioesterase [Acidobacteriota bacterium]